MTYLLTFTLIISLKGVTTYSNFPSTTTTTNIAEHHQHPSGSDCGIRPARRQPRNHHNNNHHQNQNQQNINQLYYNDRIPKIIAGSPTKEGQFAWQASLELLHPSLGFLGHWCGGVLIHQYWILSAAHCVHNDLFNLPLPPLWTVVLGEYDRNIESGYEQRIPVEKIVLHQRYQNFLNDLVLMKLSLPANLHKNSNIRKICLPFYFDENIQSNLDIISSSSSSSQILDDDLYPLDDNFLRFVQGRNKFNFTLPSMKELLTTKIANRLRKTTKINNKKRSGRLIIQQNNKRFRRRNDKIMHGFNYKSDNDYTEGKHNIVTSSNSIEYKDLPYIDCVATGWGKSNTTGDITDILLKTDVPLHSSSKCKDAYGEFVNIHKGHLCAGKLNGKGGTCVGDSGGPLQCRLTKNGPWILAGITSFGSGCALEGFPDVYTRISFYMKWIQDTINSE